MFFDIVTSLAAVHVVTRFSLNARLPVCPKGPLPKVRHWITLLTMMMNMNYDVHMGGITKDVKRQKIWDFYPLFFGFS